LAAYVPVTYGILSVASLAIDTNASYWCKILLLEDQVPARTSPTVKRRRLAAELRRYREQAKLTIDDVAGGLEWSTAKISRIENARVTVLPRDTKFLMRSYGVAEGSETWEALLTLSRQSRQKGWWHTYGDAIADWFETYVGLEASASTLRTYESEFVPGLFQTEAYARAVHRAGMPAADDDEISRHVAVRMARQELLAEPDAPELWVVVNEAAIRRVVGGPLAMREQLSRLTEATRLPNVTLQVLPFSVGAHAAMAGAFMILGFPEPADPDVVYVNYDTGTLYLEKPPEIERYTLLFDHVRAAALPVGESRDLIARATSELA